MRRKVFSGDYVKFWYLIITKPIEIYKSANLPPLKCGFRGKRPPTPTYVVTPLNTILHLFVK